MLIDYDDSPQPCRNPNFRYWPGPAYREGRDVPCQSCDATGVCEDGDQIDVDHFRDCLCGHCSGTGIEPWRPAGRRDTSAPRFDTLGRGELRAWRDRLARDKREGRMDDSQLDWVRDSHRYAVGRYIGAPSPLPKDPPRLVSFDIQDYARRLFLQEFGRAA